MPCRANGGAASCAFAAAPPPPPIALAAGFALPQGDATQRDTQHSAAPKQWFSGSDSCALVRYETHALLLNISSAARSKLTLVRQPESARQRPELREEDRQTDRGSSNKI